MNKETAEELIRGMFKEETSYLAFVFITETKRAEAVSAWIPNELNPFLTEACAMYIDHHPKVKKEFTAWLVARRMEDVK